MNLEIRNYLQLLGLGIRKIFQNIKGQQSNIEESLNTPTTITSKSEMIKLQKRQKRKCQIIMTEKDFLRIEDLKNDIIKFLKIKLEIKIKKINRKYN